MYAERFQLVALIFFIFHVKGSFQFFKSIRPELPTRDVLLSATLQNLRSGRSCQISQFLIPSHGFFRTDFQCSDQSKTSHVFYVDGFPERYKISGGNCDTLKSISKLEISNVTALEEAILWLGPYYFTHTEILRCTYRRKIEKNNLRGYPVKQESRKCSNFRWPPQSKKISVLNFTWSSVEESHPGNFEDSLIRLEISVADALLYLDYYNFTFLQPEGIPLIVPPGNGCPNVQLDQFNELNLFIPTSVSFTTRLYENDRNPTSSKVLVSSSHSFSRVENVGQENAVIYDYRLGVEYVFQPRKGHIRCEINPLSGNELDITNNIFRTGHFDANIIGGSSQAIYLGMAKSTVHQNYIWEVSSSDYQHDGTMYEKYVVNLYAKGKKGSAQPLISFVPVAIEQNGYEMKRTNGTKVLEKTYHRMKEILNYDPASYEEIYDSKYQIKDCFDQPMDRIYFRMTLKANWSKDNEAEKISDSIKFGIKEYIFTKLSISLLRIADIELSFRRDTIFAIIMIVDKPALQNSYVTSEIRLDKKAIENASRTSLNQCMSISLYSGYKELFYCNGLCLLSETGISPSPSTDFRQSIKCTLYKNKAEDPTTVAKEIALSDIASELEQLEKHSIVTPYDYRSLEILSVFVDRNSSQKPGEFSKVYLSKKLKKLPGKTFETSQSSFPECLQKCRSSELTSCTMFSACEASNKCLVSNVYIGRDGLGDDELMIDDNQCSTFVLSLSAFYEKAEEGPYEMEGVKTVPGEEEDCATHCLEENWCYGFATCQSSKSQWCTFFNVSTPPVIRNETIMCTFYKPRNIFLYNETGEVLVSDVFSTTQNLNFKQCSDICQGSKDPLCKSFNYCDQDGHTECQLAQSTVDEAYEKTRIHKGCLNYQSKQRFRKASTQDQRVKTSSLSSASIVSIVCTCLVLGLASGILSVFVFIRIRGRSLFVWQRQVDDDQL